MATLSWWWREQLWAEWCEDQLPSLGSFPSPKSIQFAFSVLFILGNRTQSVCAFVRVCMSYLVAVQCVLGCAGSDGDGVRLAACVPLTIQLLSIPAGNTRRRMINNQPTRQGRLVRRASSLRCLQVEYSLRSRSTSLSWRRFTFQLKGFFSSELSPTHQPEVKKLCGWKVKRLCVTENKEQSP